MTLQAHLGTQPFQAHAALYRQAVAHIVTMQTRGAALTSPAYLPYGIAFDVEKLTWELDFFLRHYLAAYRNAVLPQAEFDAVRGEFKVIIEELAAEPRVLCHRDYHSRNLMLSQGQLYLIDFQDARMGPDTYDLASLLRDSYVDLNDIAINELIAYFLALKGGSVAEADFRARFDLMALQRNLKAMGTFGYQTTTRQNPVYIQYMPRTLRYVRDTLHRYPRFARLYELLLPLHRRAQVITMATYIEDIAGHVGETVTLKGWLHNRRSSGKLHFLTVRDGTGFIQAVMSKAAVGPEVFVSADHLGQESAIIVTGAVRADARAPGGYELDVSGFEVVSAVARLPHHAEGARRRLPDGSAPPVDPRAAAAGDPARPARGHRRLPRLLQLARVHPRRHADLHALGVRGHDHAVPGPVLRGHHRLPHAERSALQRGECDGARPRLRVRPDVPRREVEDAPAPHRVLDGRAGDGLRLARRHDGPGRGPDRLGRLARARQAGPRAEGARARHVEARVGQAAVPAHHLRRGGREAAARPASRSNGAATSAAPTRR